MELLNYCVFGLYEGRSLYTLTEVDSLENFSLLKEDLGKIGVAYHLCELVDGLCAENQEHPDIFSLLLNTLKKIQEGEDLNRLTYDFELELLTLLGFYKGVDRSVKVDTQRLIEDILERRLKAKQILKRF